MKAITLHQPWAHLVSVGAKVYETRSWKTNYRGLLAIHASRNMDEVGRLVTDDFPPRLRAPFDRYLKSDFNWLYGSLSYGGIVAIVDLVHIESAPSVKTQLEAEAGRHPNNRSFRDEISFGDFSAGRWAWCLELVANGSVDSGIVRGYQGLWTLPAEVETRIRKRCETCGIALPA